MPSPVPDATGDLRHAGRPTHLHARHRTRRRDPRTARSPVEVVRGALDRIHASQPVLNAFITIADDTAMAQGWEAEAAVMRGDDLGPLHGVPVAVKDLVPTAGLRTTWGSLIFKDHVPDTDAVVVARLKRAGAIVVGKTTTPEFGQQCLTEAPLFGRTRNAWRGDRTSGGSSGGSAVAVAAGLVPLAVATDGGGSTRIPAACNGVVGFKQGLGVVPQEYAQDGFGNISYITPMTRTVADTALMLSVMAGGDPRDPLSTGRPAWNFPGAAVAVGDLAGTRVAWRPRLGNAAVAASVLTACEAAVGVLASLGASVSELTTPFENPESVLVRQQRVVPARAVRASPGKASRDHVPDFRAADGPRGVLQRGGIVRCDLRPDAAVSSGAGVVRRISIALGRTSSPCRRCLAQRCRSIRTSSGRSRSTTNPSRTCARPGIPTRCRST